MWDISSGFPLPIILFYLIHSPYFVYLRILPCVHMQLLAKMDSIKESYGQTGISQRHSLFDCQGAFLPMYSWGGLLSLRVRNVFWAEPSLLSQLILLFSSWSFSLQGMNLQSLCLGGRGLSTSCLNSVADGSCCFCHFCIFLFHDILLIFVK